MFYLIIAENSIPINCYNQFIFIVCFHPLISSTNALFNLPRSVLEGIMYKKFLFAHVLLLLCVSCQSQQTVNPTDTATITIATQSETATNPPILPSATNTIVIDTATPAPIIDPADLVFFYSARDRNIDIYSYNRTTGETKQLTDHPAFDDSPEVSPDGQQVVFLSARHDEDPQFPNLQYELYIMDIHGGNLQRLTNTESGEDHPAWSPDGSKIIFDADYDNDGFYEIYTIHPDGSNLQRLTHNAANDQFADWSPDGSQIAFSSDRNGNWDLFVMDSNGENQRQLTETSDWELFPAWSPDGSQIAFNGLVPGSRNTDVAIVDLASGSIQLLTTANGFDENPVWSSDGKQIAFQTNRDGNFEIYLMNADGSNQQPLFSSPSDELWPSWVK